MGWGRLLLLGNIGQQFDIQDAQEALAEMRTDVARLQVGDTDVNRRLQRLEFENDELKLYLTATTRLLLQKGLLTEAELQPVIDALDRSDGNRDGRYSGKIAPG